MPGLGTVINAIAILLGGIGGLLFGRLLTERHQDTLTKACGICVLFIGISGALEGMLTIDGAALSSGRSVLVIACIAPGALIGETLNLEGQFERFGKWLKIKTGNARDQRFVDGFVTASLTVCIGAMAIIGAIQDGLLGDYSLLVTKAVLDFIIVLIMTCSQGSVTALAGLLRPLMTAAALANLSLVGSILIFCVGLNLVWDKRVRVANLLPAVVIAVAAAFLPFEI